MLYISTLDCGEQVTYPIDETPWEGIRCPNQNAEKCLHWRIDVVNTAYIRLSLMDSYFHH